MIRISSNASYKDSLFAQANLIIAMAEKVLGTQAVKQELDRHKVIYLEVVDESDPRDS